MHWVASRQAQPHKFNNMSETSNLRPSQVEAPTLPQVPADPVVAISILVPTYNRAKYVKELLDRFKAELRKLPSGEIEVIVVDNASTDSTTEVARKFEHLEWFRFIRNASNVGASKNLFIALPACRGKYVWWMGDDDWPEPGVIGAVLNTIRWNPGVGTIFLNRRLLDAHSGKITVSEFIPDLADNYSPTLMDLMQTTGPMTLFGSISAFLFRSKPEIAENHQRHVELMTSFPHVGSLLENFYDQPAVTLGNQFVVCTIENHRPDTFDYSKFMQRSPHYGLSVGYARLLYMLTDKDNFPLYRLRTAHELSPFQKTSLQIPQFIAYHLRCGAHIGDPINIYELRLIKETFELFRTDTARREYSRLEMSLRATWFMHRVFAFTDRSRSMGGVLNSAARLVRISRRIRGLKRAVWSKIRGRR
ncbi:glycosyltransferase family 2 protein [Paraburkholderia xenovorans]|uniref:glycosyltransferase family 2 protein n=1 Tax=Paraburkholderia xenovorans TaxID=36873 RepID=UPI0038B96964